MAERNVEVNPGLIAGSREALEAVALTNEHRVLWSLPPGTRRRIARVSERCPRLVETTVVAMRLER